MMDTSRSDRIAGGFLAKDHPYRRKVQVAKGEFHATPEEVFRQFCPTREADWIDGWTVDLVYTSTGYVEPDCIFRTPRTNSLGPGLWIITRLEPDRAIEFVRIMDESVVEQCRIELEDRGDGTCVGTWTMKWTALNERGNDFLDALPDRDPLFNRVVLEGLDHYLTTGRLLERD